MEFNSVNLKELNEKNDKIKRMSEDLARGDEALRAKEMELMYEKSKLRNEKVYSLFEVIHVIIKFIPKWMKIIISIVV